MLSATSSATARPLPHVVPANIACASCVHAACVHLPCMTWMPAHSCCTLDAFQHQLSTAAARRTRDAVGVPGHGTPLRAVLSSEALALLCALPSLLPHLALCSAAHHTAQTPQLPPRNFNPSLHLVSKQLSPGHGGPRGDAVRDHGSEGGQAGRRPAQGLPPSLPGEGRPRPGLPRARSRPLRMPRGLGRGGRPRGAPSASAGPPDATAAARRPRSFPAASAPRSSQDELALTHLCWHERDASGAAAAEPEIDAVIVPGESSFGKVRCRRRLA